MSKVDAGGLIEADFDEHVQGESEISCRVVPAF